MKFKGFTLIELMIVMAIIGILAAIAIPEYQCKVQGVNCKGTPSQASLASQVPQEAPRAVSK